MKNERVRNKSEIEQEIKELLKSPLVKKFVELQKELCVSKMHEAIERSKMGA